MENPVINTLLTRRSIRQYRPNPVEPELLDLILKAGTYAPTGRGSQSPTIVAVTNEEDRQALQALNCAARGGRGTLTMARPPFCWCSRTPAAIPA